MKKNLSVPFMISIALVFFVAFSSKVPAVLAQSAAPSPRPTQEELQLQGQKRLIELQRDIELAKKAIGDVQPQALRNQLRPHPPATPLAADTTLDDGVRTETDIVTVQAMTEAVDHEPIPAKCFCENRHNKCYAFS